MNLTYDMLIKARWVLIFPAVQYREKIYAKSSSRFDFTCWILGTDSLSSSFNAVIIMPTSQ